MVDAIHETDERVLPAALPGTTLTEQVNVGEDVEDLLQHPGFKALVRALEINVDGIRDRMMIRKVDSNPSFHTDSVGHMRGLCEVLPIARGLAQNGKEAAETRRLEEMV